MKLQSLEKTKFLFVRWSLILWLWEETHVQRIVSLNPIPAHKMANFHIFCCKNFLTFVKTEKNKKRPDVTHSVFISSLGNIIILFVFGFLPFLSVDILICLMHL